MAKKSRRARRQRAAKSRRRRPSPAVAPPQSVVEATELSATPRSAGDVTSPAPSRQVDFSAEYHYVINDLRNMAVIAVAMLVVLVALSFVIR